MCKTLFKAFQELLKAFQEQLSKLLMTNLTYSSWQYWVKSWLSTRDLQHMG
jgi:hypothetical protein